MVMEEGNAWTVIVSYPEYITPPLSTLGIPACGVYRHHQQCGSSRGGMESPGSIPYGHVYIVNTIINTVQTFHIGGGQDPGPRC